MGDRRFATTQYDVWNTPSMRAYRHRNTGSKPYVRLNYSNAALLEMMKIHVVEALDENVFKPIATADHSTGDDPQRKNPYGTFPLNDDGAWLMPYEQLINPEVVESRALHWPGNRSRTTSTSWRRSDSRTLVAGFISCTIR